jgi:hypothetical protein
MLSDGGRSLGISVATIQLDHDSIVQSLASLSSSDANRKLFGANSHDYKLNPPLESSHLESFEHANRVSLPEDYRYFVSTVGNGGAGPYHELFRFGEEDSNWDYCSWAQGQLLGDVSKPFRHTVQWNADDGFWDKRPNFDAAESEDAEDEMWERWDEELERHYWCRSIMDGAIPICHLGCAKRQWLVIHGPERGFLWNDDRCDELARMTFTDWYLAWLQAALNEFRLPPYGPPGFAPAH